MDPSHLDPEAVGSPPPAGPTQPGLDRPVFPEPPLTKVRGWLAARAPRSWPGAPLRTGSPGGSTPDEAELAGPPTGLAGAGVAGGPRWQTSLVTGVVVLVAAVAGWWLVRPAPAPVEAVLPSAAAGVPVGGRGASSPGAGPDGGPGAGAGEGAGATGPVADGSGAAPTPTPAPPVVVQAAGAVHRPGVHRLAAGSRVDDLVRAAGGTTPDADLDRVNLAAPLVDGERIWVPRRGETEVPSVVNGGGVAPGGPATGSGAAGGTGGATGPGATGSEGAAPVDLNAATAAELDALPGIGPATAAAILAHRDEHGPFRSVDDLLDVRGIGEAKLEQLRPLVAV